MNVKRLKELLHNAPDHAEVVVQMNVEGEEDSPGEATHTNALGDVYEAWLRNPDEFVIDAKQTDAEG